MNLDQAKEFTYPVFARPKLRGVYCRIVDGVPELGRPRAPIENAWVRDMLLGLPCFEGRLIYGEPSAEDVDEDTIEFLSETQTGKFALWAYDLTLRGGQPFNHRMVLLGEWVVSCDSDWVRMVHYKLCADAKALLNYEAQNILAGHLGVEIYRPDQCYASPYKTQ